VVASVNGRDVHRSKVMAAAQSLPPQLQAQIDQIFPMLVERVVDFELIDMAAVEAGFADDQEVLDRLAEVGDAIIREVYLTRQVSAGVTDEAMRGRYDAFVAASPAKSEVSARHVLLENEEDAREVIAALDQGGDFAEIAGERSVGPTSARGGDLGFFSEDQMVPAFSQAAFALEIGSYTKEPVQTQFGWHVILVEDRREQAAPTFESVEAQMRQEVEREIVTNLIAELREGATIEVFPEAVAPASTMEGGAAPEEATAEGAAAEGADAGGEKKVE
jgi:peptidyl-prolyl cis-trans isomerase C